MLAVGRCHLSRRMMVVLKGTLTFALYLSFYYLVITPVAAFSIRFFAPLENMKENEILDIFHPNVSCKPKKMTFFKCYIELLNV